jgi:ADP-dependent glucokinase
MSWLKSGVTFVMGLVLAYIAREYYMGSMNASEMSRLLTSLNQLSLHQITQNSSLRVAIGYNSNVDLISSSIDMLEEMIQQFGHAVPTSDRASDVELLTSFGDLAQCFEHFFRTGSGAERFVSNKTLFEEVVSAGTSDRLLDKSSFSIGGNAALMAGKFAREGWQVLLTGAIGPKMKELLSPYPTITFANEDPGDEFHVIMEYKRSSTWNGHHPPRANRFIVTRDEANTGFVSLKSFHDHILDFHPDLLVLSGFHLLDGVSDEHTRRQRMEAVATKVAQSRKDLSNLVMTHVELASIGNRRIYEEIAQIVFPVVDSLGLNEQELSVLYQVLASQGRAHNEKSGTLQIAQTEPYLKDVIHAISYIMKSHTSLRRVHFHSLVFHLLAVVDDDQSTCEESFLASIAASSLSATEQACGLQRNNWDDLSLVELLYDTSQVKKHIPDAKQFKNRDGIMSWQQSYSFNSLHLKFYLAPVLVCKTPRHTVGLGDTISSAGLSQQVHIQKSNLCIQ